MTFAHILRSAALLVVAYDLVVVPMVVWRRTRGRRELAVELCFIVGFDALLLSAGAVLVSRWNRPVVWWSAPLVLAACLLLARSSEIGIVLAGSRGETPGREASK